MKKILVLVVVSMMVTSCVTKHTTQGYKNVWETKDGKMRKMRTTERPLCIDSWKP